MRAAAGIAVGIAVASGAAGGCGNGYEAVLDSLPIVLQRAPLGAPAASGLTGDGALYVMASPPDTADRAGQSFPMLVDTGTPLTLMAGAVPATQTETVGFDLIDPTPPPPAMRPAVRATFRGVSALRLPLESVGDGTVTPGGILGSDILRRYSVAIRFGALCTPSGSTLCSSMTFWAHLGPDLGFLQDSGYAVLRFPLFGGGETTVEGDPDFVGQRGPLVLSATRIVLRACAAPADFAPDQPRDPADKCCKNADAARLATGVDLALMLDTGVGPMVLSQSAWTRVKAKLPAAPVETPGVLRIATWPTQMNNMDTTIQATWSTIPKFALVDNETGSNTDPGPCVELGRARRIEQVSYQIVQDDLNQVSSTACTQPCDNDPREPSEAQNSAAYLELTGAIPVAVIGDEEPYLQGLRFDIRPDGPEIDGLIGAGALGRARVEIDYLSGPARALFSCEVDAPRSACWAAARCPRLPDRTYQHVCFGLPPHTLAPMCAPSGC